MKTSKKIPIAGVPTVSVGKSCGKSPVNGCGTCASAWDRRCRESRCATPSWAPAKAAPAVYGASEPSPQEYGPWQWAAAFGRATGRFGAEDARVARGREAALPSRGQPVVERSASRECLYESRPSTWPIRRIVSPVLCESSVWRKAAKGDRARRVSAVRRLLPPPAPVPVERKPVLLGPIRWVDVAGRALRRRWMIRLSQAIRRDPSACGHAAQPFLAPSPTPCAAVASSLEVAG